MAKNVKINGIDYSNVASVKLPLSADISTFAFFFDTDSGTAVAADLAFGKKAWVGGVEITGSVVSKTSSDVTVDGRTVTIPAGLYTAGVSKDVALGSATPTVAVSGDQIGDTTSSYPITINPKATVGTAGYITTIADGVQVIKYIQTETKNATPTGSSQDITPTNGKLLSKVTVAAVALTGNAIASEVLNGKTFYGSSLTQLTGTLTIPSLSLTAGVLSIS